MNLKCIIRDYQFKVISLHRALETTENHELHHVSLSPVSFSETENCFMEKMSPYWAAKRYSGEEPYFPKDLREKLNKIEVSIYFKMFRIRKKNMFIC